MYICLLFLLLSYWIKASQPVCWKCINFLEENSCLAAVLLTWSQALTCCSQAGDEEHMHCVTSQNYWKERQAEFCMWTKPISSLLLKRWKADDPLLKGVWVCSGILGISICICNLLPIFFSGWMLLIEGAGDLGLTSECYLTKSIKVLFAQTSIRQGFHPWPWKKFLIIYSFMM